MKVTNESTEPMPPPFKKLIKPQISINKINKALPASAWGLPLINKVTTSIGLTGQLYRNTKISNLNFVVDMSKDFLI